MMRPLVAAIGLLLGGCAGLMQNGPDSPWMQCEKAGGGPSQAAETARLFGDLAAGTGVGGLAAIAADPGHAQAVQDCRRKLLETRP